MTETKILSTAAMRQRCEQTEVRRMLAEAREVYLEPDQLAAEPHRESPPTGIERIHNDVVYKHEAEIVNAG